MSYEWRPQKLRAFEAPDAEAGGDVEAVSRGWVSVTPLRAAFHVAI